LSVKLRSLSEKQQGHFQFVDARRFDYPSHFLRSELLPVGQYLLAREEIVGMPIFCFDPSINRHMETSSPRISDIGGAELNGWQLMGCNR
jgi:hypothetical protein